MIEVSDLALAAPDGRLLMEGLDLVVPKGGNLLVTGPSGSGKSRLLQVIVGTERPLRGRVRVGGVDLWPGGGTLALIGRVRVGFVFASGGLLSNLSLWENAALPLRFRGLPFADIQARVDAALERVAALPLAGLRPHALSTSARRHGNLARVLALDPELILLDDPLEGLDTADRALAQNLIQAWAADSACTLVIASEELHAFSYLEAERLQLSHAAISMESR